MCLPRQFHLDEKSLFVEVRLGTSAPGRDVFFLRIFLLLAWPEVVASSSLVNVGLTKTFWFTPPS